VGGGNGVAKFRRKQKSFYSDSLNIRRDDTCIGAVWSILNSLDAQDRVSDG
jgi:hypothetical protein